MNPVRFIAIFLLSFTSLVARADVNGNLNLVAGTTDSWVYTSPLSGGTQTTLSFAPVHTEARLYTVIMALNVTGLSDLQRPVASSVTLDNAAMTFNSVVSDTSAVSFYTFLGLLSSWCSTSRTSPSAPSALTSRWLRRPCRYRYLRPFPNLKPGPCCWPDWACWATSHASARPHSRLEQHQAVDRRITRSGSRDPLFSFP